MRGTGSRMGSLTCISIRTYIYILRIMNLPFGFTSLVSIIPVDCNGQVAG